MKVPILNYVSSGVLAVIALVVTLYAFVIKQECGIDTQYLWCHTHPTKVLDIIGLGLMWAGVIYNGVLLIKYHDDAGDKTIINYLGMIGVAAGIILMWI